MAAPFIYHRTVAFGECDSARTFFSPRAVDYAVEAVEAWFEQVLGVTWADLICRHNLEARFIRTECDYQRSLVAGQGIHVRLAVAKADPLSFVLSAKCELWPAEPSFSATLEIGFVDRASGAFIPIPERFLELICSYRVQCGESIPAADEDRAVANPVTARGDDEDLIQMSLRGAVPFMRRRRVRYGECGISGHIYPPKLVESAVEVVGEWYESYMGISWMEQCIRKRGVPFVNIGCEYLRPMALGQTIAMVVRIPRLGNASIGYEVKGYDESGLPCFESRMTGCYISDERGYPQPIPFPDDLRSRVLAYQDACQGGKKAVNI